MSLKSLIYTDFCGLVYSCIISHTCDLHSLSIFNIHERIATILCLLNNLQIVHTFWKQCSVVYTVPLTIPVIRTLHVVAWVWLVAAVLLVDSSELFGFKHVSSSLNRKFNKKFNKKFNRKFIKQEI